MNTTINISLPKKMYNDAKKAVSARSYASISEFIRDAVRSKLDEENKLTINGFTPEFEDLVLKAAAEPVEHDEVWETEEDIKRDFDKIRKQITKSKKKNDKGKTNRRIHSRA